MINYREVEIEIERRHRRYLNSMLIQMCFHGLLMKQKSLQPSAELRQCVQKQQIIMASRNIFKKGTKSDIHTHR